GSVSLFDRSGARTGMGSAARQRARVLGQRRLPERRDQFQRADHDGQPHVRARDSHAGVWLRPRRRPAATRGRSRRAPQRSCGPCGLTQMNGLRYGPVPLVRATGGLADTVRDAAEPGGNGIRFTEYTPAALVEAVGRALELFRNPQQWKKLQQAGMREDFSWD